MRDVWRAQRVQPATTSASWGRDRVGVDSVGLGVGVAVVLEVAVEVAVGVPLTVVGGATTPSERATRRPRGKPVAPVSACCSRYARSDAATPASSARRSSFDVIIGGSTSAAR